jgi:hypothetical protein
MFRRACTQPLTLDCRGPRLNYAKNLFENEALYQKFLGEIKSYNFEDQLIFIEKVRNSSGLSLDIYVKGIDKDLKLADELFINSFEKMGDDIYTNLVNVTSKTYPDLIKRFAAQYQHSDLVKFKNECPKIIEEIQKKCKALAMGFNFVNDLKL